ncbi:MAG: AAA domain-containing protein [Bacteroides sp.]|nr:AAA domain-containing protein [Bacteroides sp.]
MRFSWIPFYKELADKLLKYRHDRTLLLDIIYANSEYFKVDYLHDEDGDNDKCKDIDPFTTIGIFNRRISKEKRLDAAKRFQELLSIKADVPSDFCGIPVLNNQKSHFFGFRKNRKNEDIENLWRLFEAVVQDKDCEDEFNTVIKQYIININITMGLFWIRPERFLALDKANKIYLKDKYGLNLPKNVPEYKDYISLLTEVKEKMAKNDIAEKTFYQISANAVNPTWSQNAQNDEENSWYSDVVRTWRNRKNIILYGAPGTGKTYDIPELVVRLCSPEFDTANKTREELMMEYSSLKQRNRIVFTTFHQSMDYEDWVEGLRPIVDENNQVTYTIENGIFRKICEYAERPIVKDKHVGIADDAVVWKVSLKGTGDNPVRQDCMENGYIRIGWDDYGPVISEETDWNIYSGQGKQILDAYINKMKIGDIIFSCYSSHTIDAIGVVTGDYEFINKLDSYKRVRKVNWLVKDINENIVDLNDGKAMTLSTVYRLNAISLDKVKTLLDKHLGSSTMEDNNQPYVMVIDELNRGNVSKIFGELITLLEVDKRKGCINAEEVLLPYSKKPFSISQNVYIIATMNTADRSLGTLDYAIRRRFAFIPNKPYEIDHIGFDPELFKEVSLLFISNYDEYKESGWDQSLKLIPADTLSEEYKPEDVWIGHSYFIMTNENGENCTSDRLLYDIIPLLEEYVRDGVLNTSAQDTIDRLYKLATEE